MKINGLIGKFFNVSLDSSSRKAEGTCLQVNPVQAIFMEGGDIL